MVGSWRRRKGKDRAFRVESSPHFFTIVQQQTLRDGKLKIPGQFLMKYGVDLSNPVYLKLPSGLEWTIRLKRCDGEVWFGKGWAEFSKFYSLESGHGLAFGYPGNSKFQVYIFDKSRTEMDYPLTESEIGESDDDDDPNDDLDDGGDDVGDPSDHQSEDDSRDESDDDTSDDSNDDSAQVLEKFPPCERTRGKSTIPCSQPHKKSRTSSSVKCGVTSFTQSGDAIALQRAHAFQSQHSPSFIVAMRPSYISHWSLWLPSEFRKQQIIKQSCEVSLRVSIGRTWPVDFIYETKGKALFRHGWMDFVQDNKLEVGDVCVFVLINNNKIPSFDVKIFRSREAAKYTIVEETVPETEETDQADDDCGDDSSDKSGDDSDDNSVEILDKFPHSPRKTREKSTLPSPRPHKKSRRSSTGKYDFPTKESGGGTSSTQSAKAIALHRASVFKSQNPSSLLVAMNPSYISRWFLYLPAEFHKLHVRKDSCKVILQVSNGRTWGVSLRYELGRATLGKGWMEFCRENNLEDGDVCVFVLINKNVDLVFDVAIFRTREAGKCTNYEKQAAPRMDESDEYEDSSDASGDNSIHSYDDSSDSSVKILDNFTPCPRKTREKSPQPCPQPHEKNRTSSGKVDFKSTYTFFEVAMCTADIHENFMNLPPEFVKKHLNQKHECAILRVSDGRTWPIKLHLSSDGRVRLMGGWKGFVQENSLKIDDKCVFVLTDFIDLLFDVFFYRAT